MAAEMEIIMEEPIKELKITDSVIDPTLKKKPKIEVTGSKAISSKILHDMITNMAAQEQQESSDR